jgi:hypothetical protein
MHTKDACIDSYKRVNDKDKNKVIKTRNNGLCAKKER